MGNKIKALIFDIGNVLIFYDHHIAAKKMSKIIKVDSSKIFDILHGKHKEFQKITDLGYSSKKYWNLAADLLKVRKIPYAEFDKIWNTMFWPNKEMIVLLKRLGENYKIAGISNVGVSHSKYYFKKYKIKKIFDKLFLSCDLKMIKPNKEIFQLALKELKIKPFEAIFIDDKLENVKGAKRAGIYGIHFKNNRQLLSEFKRLGIKH